MNLRVCGSVEKVGEKALSTRPRFGHSRSRSKRRRVQHVFLKPVFLQAVRHGGKADRLNSSGAIVLKDVALDAAQTLIAGKLASRDFQATIWFVRFDHRDVLQCVDHLEIGDKMFDVSAEARHSGKHVETIVRALVEEVFHVVCFELGAHTCEPRGQTTFVTHILLSSDEELISFGFHTSKFTS